MLARLSFGALLWLLGWLSQEQCNYMTAGASGTTEVAYLQIYLLRRQGQILWQRLYAVEVEPLKDWVEFP